jgi:hypothetical protein
MFAVQIGVKTRDSISPQARIDSLDELIPVLRAHELVPSTTDATARSNA